MNVKDKELAALGWSFAYFFCLLCSYYILRPVRDEMGIQGGVENLQWLFTGTFVAMLVAVPLFGVIAARSPRRKLLPLVYYFFVANILIFYLLLRNEIAVAASRIADEVEVFRLGPFAVRIVLLVAMDAAALGGNRELARVLLDPRYQFFIALGRIFDMVRIVSQRGLAVEHRHNVAFHIHAQG